MWCNVNVQSIGGSGRDVRYRTEEPDSAPLRRLSSCKSLQNKWKRPPLLVKGKSVTICWLLPPRWACSSEVQSTSKPGGKVLPPVD
ncbi:hypothetical protein J6590_015907 [Homalodisca vitripennis]|nr:hypothetical protein J6590_015907 [Homalodisca vitripennis]